MKQKRPTGLAMSGVILPFPDLVAAPAVKSELAFFVRIGEARRKLADLHAARRLPARRVVVEASRFRHRRELVKALREDGARIVLDTEAAELSAPAIREHSRRVSKLRAALEAMHEARSDDVPGARAIAPLRSSGDHKKELKK